MTIAHFSDVPVDGERQVEEELESVENGERVASGVRLVLAIENIVKQLVGGVIRFCRRFLS